MPAGAGYSPISGPEGPPAGGDGRAAAPVESGAVPPGGRRRSRAPLITVIAGVVAAALVGGAVFWYVLGRPDPADTAREYAQAWSEQDYAAMAALAEPSGEVADAYAGVAENLGVEGVEVSLGEVTRDGDTASAPFTVALSLGNTGEWEYEGELPLERASGEWRVQFTPAAIHPDLGAGQTLARTNEWGERGHILAADGTRLDTEDASGSIQMLTGTVGAATEENLEDLGPAYAEGDPVGVGGIQQAFEERLAGTPTTSIVATDAGEGEDGESAEVGSIEGTPGEDVHTSIDPAVHEAAAQAIINQDDPTALVAIRPSTGEVLAAVNVPGGYNRAVEGQYPAGSSFKIISYEALLNAGMGMDETMECPRTVELGGLTFRNAGDAEYGTQTVTEAFATSCNTALVQEVTDRIDPETLVSAAEEFGFNSELNIGIPSFSPQFPRPDGTSLLAQASIGQGQMLSSPLHMATVPAAVADGQWRSPVLVTEPEVPDQPEPRPVGNAEELRSMMRAVITEGTGSDAGFTGNVHGKTGSAEFGVAEDEDDELETHAWFVGFDPDHDVAFAVVVEGGGGGGGVAAPLAADFLNNLR